MNSMRLDMLMSQYRPGSRTDWWLWSDEFQDLWSRQPDYMAKLLADINANGIHDPICLGTDGRIWDGHHRIAVATALGFQRVPVE